MPGARLSMRKIRDVLRLQADGLSKRQIAASLGIGATAAGTFMQRAAKAGLAWPLPTDLDDAALEALLFPPPPPSGTTDRPLPDWARIHAELKRPGVTLQLLWEEYRVAEPNGLSRSWFCECYRQWEKRLSPTMRQTHVAGEKLFVDYAGTTIDLVDVETGEIHACQLFVATLGASSLTYAEATLTQTLPDWIGAHTRAFVYFGGVSAMVVSDNLKSGITKACFYEPAVNRSYEEMAQHYRTAIIPARPRKPRDKAKVEVAVQIATRWIIAKLRNAKFFKLAELNAAIAECVTALNERKSRHLGASRRDLFEKIERSALKPLPAEPHEFAAWKEVRVGFDYHVEIEKHYYSVPYTLLRETLWARITARTVELLHKGVRIAAHVRSSSNRKPSTIPEHMPSSHRRYAEWTPERLQRKAAEIGPQTAILVEVIMRERTHPEQGFRSSIGIIGLAKSYGPERLEAACARALDINARSYRSVKSILQNNLDRKRPETPAEGPAIVHANIRGSTYFH